MVLDPLSLALLVLVVDVLLGVVAYLVLRSPAMQRNVEAGLSALLHIAGEALAGLPPEAQATLVAAAYARLPLSVRTVVPFGLFASAAGYLIGIVERALATPPPPPAGD